MSKHAHALMRTHTRSRMHARHSTHVYLASMWLPLQVVVMKDWSLGDDDMTRYALSRSQVIRRRMFWGGGAQDAVGWPWDASLLVSPRVVLV